MTSGASQLPLRINDVSEKWCALRSAADHQNVIDAVTIFF
jgi:hypothetical protein